MTNWLPPLKWEDQKTVYAMSGEDGILERILQHIWLPSRVFVEIGINLNSDELAKGKQVLQGNCVLLKERGWTGWWFDGQAIDGFPINPEYITPLNINSVLRKYNVPEHIDVFSLDTDGQDFWIFMALNRCPAVVILELNSHFDLDEHMTVEYNLQSYWAGDQYFGASTAALNDLAIDKGYVLVYCNGANAFFVRRDFLDNPDDFVFENIAFRTDYHKPHAPDRIWVDVQTGQRVLKRPPPSER